MTRERTVNHILEGDIQDLDSRVKRRLLAAIGVYGSAQGIDPVQYPISSYHLQTLGGILQAYIITPGRFIIFEVEPTTMQSLSIVVPAERIRRVIESCQGETLTVTIELDADVQTITTSSQSFEAAMDDPKQSDARSGVSTAESKVTFANYTLSSSGEGEHRDSLWDFATTVRNVIGF